MPTTLGTKPRYNPTTPSAARVFLYTSTNPANCLCPPLPALFASAERRVRALSKSVSGVDSFSTDDLLIERVHKDGGRCPCSCTTHHVAGDPEREALSFLEIEHLFEGVFECEVEGLGGEVTQDVGPVATPNWVDSPLVPNIPTKASGFTHS